MADFHALRVKEIRKETDDTVSVVVDIPEQLKKIFSYKQGQYLTVKKKLNGQEVRRSYSLCSSPVSDDEWRIAVKKVKNGLFSTYANEAMKEGDILEVMTPAGNFFTEVKEDQKKRYVAFAAGSGITPIMSILKTVLAVEKESSFLLYYGNRYSNGIIFRDELKKLKEAFGDRLVLRYVLSGENSGDFEGRINGEKCEEFDLNQSGLYTADEYFICGPEEMIFSLRDKLTSKGVSKEKIHFELFTTPVAADESSTEEIPDLNSEVTIVIDGEEYTYTLSSKGDSVLDASMDAGADVPFSCKGAVCCTCRAKVLEGKVRMALNYALTDQEVEDGYVLTCQSHPLTEKVVIDYDAD
jgi:ring-1,2-phenylacetyl-CoA epoxidase subunit PaaE